MQQGANCQFYAAHVKGFKTLTSKRLVILARRKNNAIQILNRRDPTQFGRVSFIKPLEPCCMSTPPDLDPIRPLPSSSAYSDLSEKWRFRFSFFDQYGLPGTASAATPEYKAAFMALPFRQRLTIGYNFFAFFFSFIYLFILGLWRQGLVVLGIFLVPVLVGWQGPQDVIYQAITLSVSILVAMRANIWYYRKRVLNQEFWSIF